MAKCLQCGVVVKATGNWQHRTKVFCCEACRTKYWNLKRRKPLLSKKCPMCGAAFKTARLEQKFCSLKCSEKHHPDLNIRTCPNCERTFKPKRIDSLCCSSKCSVEYQRDLNYFNGKRKTAVGFKERTCWICGKPRLKKINVHHVLGKYVSDEPLAVLCPGCHHLLTQLSCRVFLDDAQKVADLITLARFAKGLNDAKTIVEYQYT